MWQLPLFLGNTNRWQWGLGALERCYYFGRQATECHCFPGYCPLAPLFLQAAHFIHTHGSLPNRSPLHTWHFPLSGTPLLLPTPTSSLSAQQTHTHFFFNPQLTHPQLWLSLDELRATSSWLSTAPREPSSHCISAFLCCPLDYKLYKSKESVFLIFLPPHPPRSFLGIWFPGDLQMMFNGHTHRARF